MDTQTQETGFITEAKDYLISIEGFPTARINDIIQNKDGKRALVTALDRDNIKAILLDRNHAKSGDQYWKGEHGVKFSFGDHLFGRIINALGEPLDEGDPIPPGDSVLELEEKAPGISERAPISNQLYTGVTLVDTLLPIAKGQRQLVVGPTSSGKTSFLQNIVANQKTQDTICIYALIGKPTNHIQNVARSLLIDHESERTIVVAASSDESASMVFIAPTVAFAMAEHFMNQGKDVLIVLDDMATHAKYLREIALLSGRIPGRESYPGDIFYQHAHLIERAGQFGQSHNNGSITCVPVLETNIEDLTSLVATNLMAATDGHLFFSASLYAEGYYPAILSEESVTRVGRKTQTQVQKQLSIRMLALLTDYGKRRNFSRFGAQLSDDTQKELHQGELISEILRQEAFHPISYQVQAIMLTLAMTPFLLGKDLDFLKKNHDRIEEILETEKEFRSLKRAVDDDSVDLDVFIERVKKKAPLLEKYVGNK